jgi:hypothetical protein
MSSRNELRSTTPTRTTSRAARTARDVGQHVDPIHVGADRCRQVADVIEAGEICPPGVDPLRRDARCEVPGGAGEGRIVAAHEMNVRSGIGEAVRERCADAGGCAGHESDVPVENTVGG